MKFSTIREAVEENEKALLHKRAMLSVISAGRDREESPCPVRTVFQRDRDRIIHSKTFRRLGRKTQVFLNPDGDHYRNRLTHTLEVTQIARTIALGLKLNENLVEAIALGHDLGHTPFGHSGEAALRKLAKRGFHHAHQSLRVVEKVEGNGKGLNLTVEVRNGIVKHSKGKGPILTDKSEILPSTLEGEVVRLADIIAYVNHDLEDGIRAGLIKESSIPSDILKVLGNSHSERVGRIVSSVIYSTDLDDGGHVTMDNEIHHKIADLRSFLYENCYDSPLLRREFTKAERLLEDLWEYYLKAPELIPGIAKNSQFSEEILVDWLSGMTDRYAIRIWKEITVPKSWFTSDLPQILNK